MNILNPETYLLHKVPSLHTHASEVLSIIAIVVAVILAIVVIDFLFKFLIPKSSPKLINTLLRVIRRVLKGVVIFGGIFLISTIFSSYFKSKSGHDYSAILVSIALIGLSTVVLASVSRALFTNLIDSMERKEKDITKYSFLRAAIEISIYFLGAMAIFMSFPGTEKFAKTILGGAGILALIAGFAAQETVSNVLAGVFIIFSKPFKIGDAIKVADNMMGNVWDISLRHTIIKDYDNKMIVIPNSIINKEKIFNYNLGDERACERIEFEIDLKADVDLARQIMAEEVEKHEWSIDPRSDYERDTGVPRVVTRLIRLTESGMVVKVWAWTATFDHAYAMRCDLIDSIKKRFDQEGIDIPYPHRTVIMKEPKNESSTH